MYNIPLVTESPVINPQKIASASPGLDQLAQGLEKGAMGAAEVAITMASWKSNAYLYTDMATLGQLEGDTVKKFELAKSPEEVNEIMNQYRTESTAFMERSHVNQNDRRTLNYMAGRQIMEMERMSGDLQARLTTNGLRTDLMGNFPQVLNQYQHSLFNDPEHADKIYQSTVATYDTAYQNGLITREQHEKAIDALGYAKESATSLFGMAAEGKADAVTYHKYTSLDGQPLYKKEGNQIVQQFAFNQHETGLLDDAISDLHEGKLDPFTFFNLNKNQQIVYQQSFEGIRDANALFNSNMPIPVIENRFKQLNEQKGLLTTSEKAERDQIQQRLNLLKTDYLGFLDTTTAGAQLTKQYKSSVNGIENSNLSNEQKYDQLLKQKNSLVADSTALGQAMGIDTRYIKPAEPQDVAQIQNAFTLGSDPSGVGDVIKSYSKKNGGWLANSIDNPNQSELIGAASLARDKNSFSYLPDMIIANQKSQDYSAVEGQFQKEEKTSLNNQIDSSVITKLKPTFDFLKNFPNGGQKIQSILNDTRNYVKYQARGTNDLSVSNMKDYINQATQLFSDAYSIQHGNGYAFNTNQINLASGDLKNVVSFVNNAVKMQLTAKLGEADAEEALDSNPITVTNSPTGQLIAVDSHGVVIRSFDFNPETLAAARTYSEREKKVSELSAIGMPPKQNIVPAEVQNLINEATQ